MNQMRHIFLAALILLSGWSLFWLSQQVQASSAGRAPVVAAAAAAPAKGGTTAGAALPGKPLFQQNCAACHALDKDMTGPALAGFTGRGPWADRKQVYAWVKNPSAYMAKDAYTKGLQKQFGAVMMSFPGLAEKDIDLIVDYIEAAGK